MRGRSAASSSACEHGSAGSAAPRSRSRAGRAARRRRCRRSTTRSTSPFDVRLGERVRDRLRVAVRRPVAEAGPGLADAAAAGSGASTAPSCPSCRSAPRGPAACSLAHERERAAEHLRVERAGEAAIARDRHDRDGLHRPRAARAAAAGTAPAACAVPAISSSIRSAYGRIASIRCCARRRRAEATSSIARVSLRVFEIERTRRLRSWVEANGLARPAGRR